MLLPHDTHQPLSTSEQVSSPRRFTCRDELAVAIALALLTLVSVLVTTNLSFQSVDEVGVFTVARNLVSRGSFEVDILQWMYSVWGRGSNAVQGPSGHFYNGKDIAVSALIIPLLSFANMTGLSPIRTAFLFSPLISAVTISLFYLFIRSLGFNKTTGTLSSLTYALATLTWPYAETLFLQSLAALGMLLALWGGIRVQREGGWRSALVSGLGMGIAGLSALPLWGLLPLHAFNLIPWRKFRERAWREDLHRMVILMASFGAGAGGFFFGGMAYNFARYGSWLNFPNAGARDLRPEYMIVGVLGQLLSAPRGLVWYVPVAMLVPFGIWLGRRTISRPMLLAIGQFAFVFGIYGSFFWWWGGLGWAERYHVVIMPALVLLVTPLLDYVVRPNTSHWARIPVATVLLVSSAIQLMSGLLDSFKSDADMPGALWHLEPLPGTLLTTPILRDPGTLPIPRLVKLAQEGQWHTLWLSSGRVDWLLLGLLCALLALAVVCLLWALRSGETRAVWPVLALQSAFSIALIGFMLIRYPWQEISDPFSPFTVTQPTGLRELASVLASTVQPDDGVITVAPYSYLAWLDVYDGSAPDAGFLFEDPLSEESAQMLRRIYMWYPRVWLVTQSTPGDPANGVERWLSENAFVGSEEWFGDTRLVPYTFPLEDQEKFNLVNQSFSSSDIQLEGYSFQIVSRPGGGWANVWLRWEAGKSPPENYSIFVHLLDGQGVLVAQHDGWPAAGYAPTISWKPGVVVDDRHSIPLPANLAVEGYVLEIGLYSPTTGKRLPLLNSSGDHLRFELDLLLPQ